MIDKELILNLEEKLDKEFEKNPLKKGNFLKEYIRLSGHSSYELSCKGSIQPDSVQLFYAIFNNLHNFNEISVQNAFSEFLNENANDYKNFIQCASLHITFPQLHREILKINNDNGLYFVDYVSEEAKNIEVQDSILTNVSLPNVGKFSLGNKEIAEYFINKINNNERIDLYEIIDYLKEIFSKYQEIFLEQSLIQYLAHSTIFFIY